MSTVTPAKPLQADARGVRTLEFAALGTTCSIKFRLPDDRAALTFGAEVLDWIGRFEAKFSRFKPDSLVSRVNREAGGDWVAVDAEMEHLLNLAEDLHYRTD